MATNKHKPIPIFTPKEIARFHSKIEKGSPDECWPWKGRRDKDGYGCFETFKGNDTFRYRTIRVAYALAYEDPGDYEVAHSCDNPPCVNYENHLSKKTHVENMKEIKQRGRQAKGDRSGSRMHPERLPRGDNHPSRKHPERYFGTKNPMAILNAEQVREIRSSFIHGKKGHPGSGNAKQLSERFGLCPGAIRRVANGTSYRDVTSETPPA